MRDQVFTGPDVQSAVRAAAAALGVPEHGVRYVVLAPGGTGAPAQVAVLLERPAQVAAPPPAPARAGSDPRTRLRRVVREIAEAAALELSVESAEGPDALSVELRGAGVAALLRDGGRALKALEHLLQRMFGHELEPARLLVTCAGFREARDAWLRELASEAARRVRESGAAEELEPLNAYERRIVHVALDAAPGVRTYSVGEGAARRVVVAPDPAPAGPA